MRKLVAVLLLAIALPLLASCSIGIGHGNFTGTFMLDNRPNNLFYLSLVQTNNEVNGYLQEVHPGFFGGTTGTEYPVSGTVDGDVASLEMKAFFNLVNVTIAGRKNGDRISLALPSNSGEVGNMTFQSASRDKFNQAVSEWQKELARKR